MNQKTSTYHISVFQNDIAPIVLMVGSPTRAEDYAHKLLKNPKLVCNIRLINMWTGTYNDKPVTITSHGMGFSSMGIYAHELFNFFGVEKIIRLGTCATYKKDINIGEIIIGNNYFTYSKFGEGYEVDPEIGIAASYNLLKIIDNQFKKDKLKYHVGGIYSSEWFYAPAFKNQGVKTGSIIDKKIQEKEIIGKEMESYVLQLIANYYNKEAITIATVLTNITTNKFTKSDEYVDVLPMAKSVLKALFD